MWEYLEVLMPVQPLIRLCKYRYNLKKYVILDLFLNPNFSLQKKEDSSRHPLHKQNEF